MITQVAPVPAARQIAGTTIAGRAAPRRTPSDGDDRGGRSLRILVVDDDLDTRLLLSMLLREVGEVCEAADLPAAQAAIDHHDVDVLVLDMLVDGERGPSLLEALRIAGRSIPTVVVTGLPRDHAFVRAARDAGAAVVVTKPFDAKTLRDSVDAVATVF